MVTLISESLRFVQDDNKEPNVRSVSDDCETMPLAWATVHRKVPACLLTSAEKKNPVIFYHLAPN